jgi:glycosyltransferase involved in cell wall biosynthesis
MEKICVIMSTYNGEKYLREQLQSILDQEDVSVDIFVRDDGSCDGTVEILKSYKEKGLLDYYVGKDNLGSGKSFFDLLWNVKLSYDYYALSDQDDFWLSNKLSRAISILDSINDEIKVYSSNYTIVDNSLNNIDYRKPRKVYPTFGNSLIENQVTGCTVVMSKAFLKEVRTYAKPQKQYIHDWWIYKTALIFGTLYIDNESRILYRQHSSNTIGLSKNIFKRFKRVIDDSSNIKERIITQNKEILEIYPLSEENIELIDIINYKRKMKLLFNSKIKRCKKLETIIFKLWMIFW